MAGPLSSIRVVDCSEGVSGPKAAMMLADFGAEVVKVELPEGDPARTKPGYVVWNRGKRRVTLDYRTAEGKAQLESLLAGADVCVLSQSAAELRAVGLEASDVSARYPGLVVLWMPGFTSAGPESELPASAQLLSAASGISYEQYSYDDL